MARKSTMSSRRRILLFVALMSILTLGATPARAGFDDVVRAVESRYHVRHTGIPFFGLIRFALWVPQPNGVSDLQLATFEHTHLNYERAPSQTATPNPVDDSQPPI